MDYCTRAIAASSAQPSRLGFEPQCGSFPADRFAETRDPLSGDTTDLLHPRVVAWREASGGRSDELLEGRVPSGEEGGCEELPFRGEAVAVSLRDLVDEPVGAEQAEVSGVLGGEPGGRVGRGVGEGGGQGAGAGR